MLERVRVLDEGVYDEMRREYKNMKREDKNKREYKNMKIEGDNNKEKDA